MIFRIKGKKYNFDIVLYKANKDFCFFIRAICKFNGRFSCINNLNAILSEFNIVLDDTKVEDSLWVVKKEYASYFNDKAKHFLSDISFLSYLENQLDKDRLLGEWENFYKNIIT